MARLQAQGSEPGRNLNRVCIDLERHSSQNCATRKEVYLASKKQQRETFNLLNYCLQVQVVMSSQLIHRLEAPIIFSSLHKSESFADRVRNGCVCNIVLT